MNEKSIVFIPDSFPVNSDMYLNFSGGRNARDGQQYKPEDVTDFSRQSSAIQIAIKLKRLDYTVAILCSHFISVYAQQFEFEFEYELSDKPFCSLLSLGVGSWDAATPQRRAFNVEVKGVWRTVQRCKNTLHSYDNSLTNNRSIMTPALFKTIIVCFAALMSNKVMGQFIGGGGSGPIVGTLSQRFSSTSLKLTPETPISIGYKVVGVRPTKTPQLFRTRPTSQCVRSFLAVMSVLQSLTLYSKWSQE